MLLLKTLSSKENKCVTVSRRDSDGVLHVIGTQGFASLPWEPWQHPMMCFSPQQQLRHPLTQPCPAQEGVGVQGHLACPAPGCCVSLDQEQLSARLFPLSFWAVISGNGADSQEKYEISTLCSQDGCISTNQHFKRAWACVCSWEADEMIWGFEAASLENLLSPREWC